MKTIVAALERKLSTITNRFGVIINVKNSNETVSQHGKHNTRSSLTQYQGTYTSVL